MGSPTDQPSEQKALTFEQARGIQADLEQLPGNLCSHLVSLADRPTAYRVEMYVGAVYPHEVAGLAAVAAAHGAAVSIVSEDDPRPAYGMVVRFDKPRAL